MEIDVVNLKSKFGTINEFWSPKIVGELNNQHVKIAKFKGDFVMHQHDNEDELFFVAEGTIFIELESKTLEIKQGEFVVIPKGVPHRPYAPEPASVLLFEPATTVNTGNIENELTIKDLDKI